MKALISAAAIALASSTAYADEPIIPDIPLFPPAAESVEVDTHENDNVDPNRIYENLGENGQEPVFPGGKGALMKYVADHLRYPSTAQMRGIQGIVTVQFVVTNTGAVGQAKVVRGLDPDLDKEAVRIAKSLPKFIPAKVDGMPVNCWYTLPVTFKLYGN